MIRLVCSRSGIVEVVVVDGELSAMDGAEPVRVAVDTEPVSSQNVFLFHKTTRRNVYDEAASRHPDADDVVLVNERGEITESTVANVVARIGDQWWTPPLDCGLLAGVQRRVLLEKGTVRERVITVDELKAADAVALVNSVRGWRTAHLIG